MQQLSAITKTLILTGFSALSLWTSAAQAASFRGLCFLSNSSDIFYSYADIVSADGSVIVGYGSSVNGGESFRWTESGGMVALPGIYATGVSGDGSVIVGISPIGFQEYEAFRWTESGGMVGLGDLPGYYPSIVASGVSGDGSVIVGYGQSFTAISDQTHHEKAISKAQSRDHNVGTNQEHFHQ
jgi:probable HAF family extracellular repeat protein